MKGPSCVRIACCERPACDEDERYRDGYCHSGPTFFGWRSHRRATCNEGWLLDATKGICRKSDCPGGQPPPPVRAAGPDDPPPRSRSREDAPAPPVANPAEVTRLLPAPCVDRGGTVTIEGERFGRQQGARRAVLGGHGISVTLRIRRWSDNRITAVIPDADRIDPGQWYYVGIQDENGNWISNLSKTVTICRTLE